MIFYLLTVSVWPRRINVPNFVKIGCSVAEILRFFEFSRWLPPPSWILKSRNFIGYWNPQGGDASVCQILSKSVSRLRRYQDLFGAYLNHQQWLFGGLYHCAKFGYDRCSSFYNMNISIFGTFPWKIPFHAPKIGAFWATWSPKWATITTKAKSGTPLRESASFKPLSVKIWWAVWPVGAFFKKGV